MSKLDDILNKPMTERDIVSMQLGNQHFIAEHIKREIKELFIDIVGVDIPAEHMGAQCRNEFRDELRDKIRAL